jgi:hypothetical protein
MEVPALRSFFGEEVRPSRDSVSIDCDRISMALSSTIFAIFVEQSRGSPPLSAAKNQLN